MSYEKLIEVAIKSKESSYSPYSKFRVGAALLTKDGRIFSGCNIENASFGATICAERTAMVKALSEGARSFEAIAIVSDKEGYTFPCGICRQFLSEFGLELKVVLPSESGTKIMTLGELLPEAFLPKDLSE